MSNQPSPKGSNDGDTTAVVVIIGGISLVLGIPIALGRGIMYFLPGIWLSLPDSLRFAWNLITVLVVIAVILAVFLIGGAEPNCFVATAVYGSSTHPDVLLFKSFRDRVLLKKPLGKLFVRFYYVFGPYLAKLVIFFSLKKFMHKQLSALASLLRRMYRL